MRTTAVASAPLYPWQKAVAVSKRAPATMRASEFRILLPPPLQEGPSASWLAPCAVIRRAGGHGEYLRTHRRTKHGFVTGRTGGTAGEAGGRRCRGIDGRPATRLSAAPAPFPAGRR